MTNLRRFLQIGLFGLLFFSVGFLAYTQIRPSADSVTPIATNTIAGLYCPADSPSEMPSWSSEQYLGNYPDGQYSIIREALRAGSYEYYQKIFDPEMISSSTGQLVPAHTIKIIGSITGPATVSPYEDFIVTSRYEINGGLDDTGGPQITTYKYRAGAAGTVATYGLSYKNQSPYIAISIPVDRYIRAIKSGTNTQSPGVRVGSYVVGPSGPREFTVTSDAPHFSFVGSETPNIPFEFSSSVPSQLQLITPQTGLTISPIELLIYDQNSVSATVEGTLVPGAVQVSGTAQEACGGTSSVSATGYAYDLKVLTENPTLTTSQVSSDGSEIDQKLEITELQIGLDGWTQLQTDAQRAEFKKYFTGKQWKVTLLGRNTTEDEYGYITNVEAGIKDQTTLTKAGTEGSIILPIQTDEWTTDQAGQLLQIRPTRFGIHKYMALRLEIVDTDAVREFALKASKEIKMGFLGSPISAPTDAIDPKDEDQVVRDNLITNPESIEGEMAQ